MKPKFTQGPWAAKHEKTWVVRQDFNPSQCVAICESGMAGECEANARLIASAPALYAALSQLISELPSKRDWLDPMLEKECLQVLRDAGGAK